MDVWSGLWAPTPLLTSQPTTQIFGHCNLLDFAVLRERSGVGGVERNALRIL
ncbi:MAG: hypothetical protein U9N01_00065 [Euryarchaeota archaeon]|nr:hypothetical protein [Euryarchaeota archaeon]